MAVSIHIVRDPRESLRKCSLKNIQGLPNIAMMSFRTGWTLDLPMVTLLDHRGPPLSPSDPLLLLALDCSWKRLPILEKCLPPVVVRRSIPAEIKTAYPRISARGDDPENGLATLEALYVATVLLGQPRSDLLEGYHWREQFLVSNGFLTPTLPKRP